VIESRGEYDSVRETEALIRSASGYVRVSSNLRPRVIESSQLSRRELGARRVIRQIALVAVVVTWSLVCTVDRMNLPRSSHWLSSNSEHASQLSTRSAGGVGEDWALVDSFEELRGRIADILRL